MVNEVIDVNVKNIDSTDNIAVRNKKSSKFNNFFKITARGSTIKKELIGGLSTFLAMVYILFVNPSIISGSSPSLSSSFGGLFLGTTIITFLGTLLLGLLANVPLVQAPGMGINSFLTYTVCLGFKLSYGEALICVMVSGILYTIVCATPLRKMITESVPKNFKISISVMIGLFIAYVGLTNSGIVTLGTSNAVPTSVFSNFNNPKAIGILVISIIGIFLGVTLHFCKVKFSIIITIAATLVMLLIAGGIDYSNIGLEIYKLNNYKDLGTFAIASKEMFGSFKTVFTKPLAYVAMFCFLYVNLFDTTSVITWARNDEGFILINKESENKKIGWVSRAYLSNAISSTVGAFMLSSNLTTYVESASGIKSGARTGLSSIFTSLFILLCIPLYPILNPLLPIDIGNNNQLQPIAGPISVLIGTLIISELRHFNWKEFADIPVLLFIIIFGFLGYAISLGIAMGSILYVLI
ncbi:MAG: NCS2 family permease, partial [Ureaplasma sp.]|nr:NCS2 family permease [Ureaplasma sp.]